MTYSSHVIAPEGCGPRLTPGKRYEVEGPNRDAFYLTSDDGSHRLCHWKNCAYLNSQDWIIPPPKAPERLPDELVSEMEATLRTMKVLANNIIAKIDAHRKPDPVVTFWALGDDQFGDELRKLLDKTGCEIVAKWKV